jgi:hypothetical protein
VWVDEYHQAIFPTCDDDKSEEEGREEENFR